MISLVLPDHSRWPSWIDAIDELDPDRTLIDKLDQDVRQSFPDDYIWTNL